MCYECFSQPMSCLFMFLIVFSDERMAFILMKSNFLGARAFCALTVSAYTGIVEMFFCVLS